MVADLARDKLGPLRLPVLDVVLPTQLVSRQPDAFKPTTPPGAHSP
jgi:hypothetical protein